MAQYLKRQFTKWFDARISDELDSEKELEDTDIKLHLSLLKSFYAKW